jgi:hypothetical protein
LEEFFSMVNFTNPGVLGDASYFRRYYEVSMELEMKGCTAKLQVTAVHSQIISVFMYAKGNT